MFLDARVSSYASTRSCDFASHPNVVRVVLGEPEPPATQALGAPEPPATQALGAPEPSPRRGEPEPSAGGPEVVELYRFALQEKNCGVVRAKNTADSLLGTVIICRSTSQLSTYIPCLHSIRHEEVGGIHINECLEGVTINTDGCIK